MINNNFNYVAYYKIQHSKTSTCNPNYVGHMLPPPPYLSIEGHEDCLSKHSAIGSSHTEVCLPYNKVGGCCKPLNCKIRAWIKLKHEVREGRLDRCRKSA